MPRWAAAFACIAILAIAVIIGISRIPSREAQRTPTSDAPKSFADIGTKAPDAKALPAPTGNNTQSPANSAPESRLNLATTEHERLEILKSWTVEDPKAAFAWLLQSETDNQLNDRHLVFFETLLQAHPDRLGEFLLLVDAIAANYPEAQSTAESSSRLAVLNVISALLESTTDTDFHPALLQVRSAFPEELGISVEYTIARIWSHRSDDPAKAINWLMANERLMSERKSTFRMVLDHWTRKEPVEAATWAASAVEKNLLPPETMKSVAFRWGQMDAASAFEWLELTTRSEINSPWIDPAIGSLVLGVAGESPAEAIRWTNEIQDLKTRNHTLAALPKWTWDNKAAWDTAVLTYLTETKNSPEAAPQRNQWLTTIHAESARMQATKALIQRPSP